MARTVRKLITSLSLTAASGVGAMCLLAAAPDNGNSPQQDPNVISALTEPSKRSPMNFQAMGMIRAVSVKEGQAVKKGDVLMAQDTDIEGAELERLKAEADSDARVAYYLADRDLKQKTLDRKTGASDGAFALSEIEEAKADFIKAERQIDVANLDHLGDKIKAKQQQIKVDKMVLRSELDGSVEEIKSWEGQLATPDPDKPAIVVVKNDPCYVVIRTLTTRQVAQLKMGQKLDVRYPGETEWRQATINFIAPVATATSDTQVVKLELPNAENRATGLPIEVKLPPGLIESSAAEKTAMR